MSPSSRDKCEKCGHYGHIAQKCRGVSEIIVGSKLRDHLVYLSKKSSVNIKNQQQEQVAEFLIEFQDVFAWSDFDLGQFTSVQDMIDISNARPIR